MYCFCLLYNHCSGACVSIHFIVEGKTKKGIVGEQCTACKSNDNLRNSLPTVVRDSEYVPHLKFYLKFNGLDMSFSKYTCVCPCFQGYLYFIFKKRLTLNTCRLI